MNPMMNRYQSLKKQNGAALFIVVIIFLLLLPIIVVVFFNRSVSNVAQGVSTTSHEAAANTGDVALAALRAKIDTALMGGLLEYQGTKPAWFITNPVDVRSSGFWTTCLAAGTCVQSTLSAPSGTNPSTAFTVTELVTPTGVIDPIVCGQDGFVGVFYNIFIHTQAANVPANGGNTLQSVYRTCQKI